MGTSINVSSNTGPTYGLKIGNGTSISGSNVTITADSASASATSYGIYVSNTNATQSKVNLGTGSSVESTGVGIYLIGNSSLSANALTVNSLNSYALMVDRLGATADIGTGSTISSSGSVSTVWVYGDDSALVAGENTTFTHTGTYSNNTLLAQGGGSITVGSGSKVISTVGGGIAASNGTINYNGSSTARNIIQTASNYAVSAQQSKGVVNMSYTDIDTTSTYGLWAVASGTINMDNVNLNQTGGSYGLVASQGGKINLSGENNLQTVNDVLMIATGSNSAITGSGKETLVGSLVAQDRGAINLTMTDGSYWSGATYLLTGGTMDLSIEGNSAWHMTGDSTITSLGLTNDATVYLSSSDTDSTRHTLTITGDYTSNAGKFVFYGDLNGDTDSSIDQLVINGNVVLDTNQTKVSVQNIGGLGEKTIEGIKIITVTGDSPDAFVQDGRIVAGAYDYYLQQGNASGEDTNNWYLTNELSPEEPIRSVRAEAGVYLGNLYAANNVFQLSLHDRMRDITFTPGDDKDRDKDKDIWVRMDKRKVNGKTNPVGGDIRQDYTAVQFGYDLLRRETSTGDSKSFMVAGIIGGYGNTSTTVKGTEYNATGSLHGWSIGPYATWFRESSTKSVRYLDVWGLWNRLDGTTNGQDIASESYRLDGLTLSAEVGYDQRLSKGNGDSGSNHYLRWQGQVTYQGVNGGNKVESNGTVVDLSNRNIQTRLGVRYYSKSNKVEETYNHPYVELNWYHNTNPTSIEMDETKVSLQGIDNIGEIKIGTEYKLRKSLELWGYMFYAAGGSGYSSYGARIGVKTAF